MLGFLRRHFALLGLSLFALGWLVARACLQAVVIDEADSYLTFGTGDWTNAWYPSSGNHVLNTILFRVTTGAFGLHEWSLRLPALLGAVLYIGASVYLCARITRAIWLQAMLFVCLVFNPLVMDYLVAARGYSLAVGLLMAAIALLWTEQPALASVCLGLSFCANFSFAIVDAVTMLLSFLMMGRKRPLACFLPGVAVAAAVCGRTLVRYPRGELHFGSSSLLEMWQGLVTASFYEFKYDQLVRFIPLLLPSLAVVLTVVLLAASWRRREPLTLWLAAVIVVTLTLHWMLFRTLHLLLPKDRTALFFLPLFTLLFGALTADRPKGVPRFAGGATLAVAGIYFLCCLRLTYFKEWKYDADAKNLYRIVDDLNRRCGIDDPFVEWHYSASLNFYRALHGNRKLPHFESGFVPFPVGRLAYVYWHYHGVVFVQQQGLKVIYADPKSQADIAIRSCGTAK
jgi:general stress protein CsbA